MAQAHLNKLNYKFQPQNDQMNNKCSIGVQTGTNNIFDNSSK